MVVLSIKNVEFHLVLQLSTSFLSPQIFNWRAVSTNFSKPLGVTVQKAALSRIFSTLSLITFYPFFTIKFNMCAQQRVWKNFSFNISELLESLPKRMLIKASFDVQLSTVKEDNLRSTFQSNKQSIKALECLRGMWARHIYKPVIETKLNYNKI